MSIPNIEYEKEPDMSGWTPKQIRGFGGSSPRYTSVEQVEGLIEQYFTDCEGKILTDADGNPILTKFGQPVIVGQKPPTMTGLALALGFESRTSLWNYKGKKEFRKAIQLATSRIEQYTEERLFDRDGARGAQFVLSHNFKGWKDEEKSSGEVTKIEIINDIPAPAPAEKPVEETQEPENGGEANG